MTFSGSEGEKRAQDTFGSRKRALAFYSNQWLEHLNAAMQAFIARQEMVWIASADSSGACDCSFRAGPPGFVRVLDSSRLAFPEYRGNGVMASIGNIMENPHIGMIFLDLLETTVGLHVNGQARVLSNEAFEKWAQEGCTPRRPSASEGGPRPERWIVVQVAEAYIHCSKHVPLLEKRAKHRAWGTDDARAKGGDFFQQVART